jgi:pyruvate carboxylase
MKKTIKKLLVANRSEIAIRVMRGAAELGIGTVAVYAEEDRFALHRFKADESYKLGAPGRPLAAYLDIETVLRIAQEAGVDAIHPGYGFLSENPDFADACAQAGIIFIGPPSTVMRALGNKVSARTLAERAGVPVMPATGPLPDDLAAVTKLAAQVGYPLMLKASWGGGGRGMRVIREAAQLEESVAAARREAKAAFGNDEVYLEKLVERARHVEVQILGDAHGNIVHLFERDCTVQRRNQKVVERAPAPYLSTEQRDVLCAHALRLAKAAKYRNAARWSSSWIATPVRFISSRSIRASRSNTPSPRKSPESISSRRRFASHKMRASARPTAVSRRRRTSASTATRCSAGSRPRIRRTTSFRTTAESAITAALQGSAFVSMEVRPTPAP